MISERKIRAAKVKCGWDMEAIVKCPHCKCERAVEVDADYIVECEGCGKKYRVIPFI